MYAHTCIKEHEVKKCGAKLSVSGVFCVKQKHIFLLLKRTFFAHTNERKKKKNALQKMLITIGNANNYALG